MRETFVTYMPWLLSVIGCFMIYKVGKFKNYGWLIGLFAQVLWFAWIIAAEHYGFLIQNVALFGLYLKNWLDWRKSGIEAIYNRS